MSAEQEKIKDVAYRLWLDAGSPDGRDQEFWFAAEAQVKVPAKPKAAPKPKAAAKPKAEPKPKAVPKAKAPAKPKAAPKV